MASDAVLLDTSALYALLNPDDAHHQKALAVNEALIAREVVLVLPNFLLAETHAIINKRVGPKAARDFLNAAVRSFEIERVTIEDEVSAYALLQETSRRRNLSYFDAVAATVAERLGIGEVFSFDRHYRSLGFRLAR